MHLIRIDKKTSRRAFAHLLITTIVTSFLGCATPPLEEEVDEQKIALDAASSDWINCIAKSATDYAKNIGTADEIADSSLSKCLGEGTTYKQSELDYLLRNAPTFNAQLHIRNMHEDSFQKKWDMLRLKAIQIVIECRQKKANQKNNKRAVK